MTQEEQINNAEELKKNDKITGFMAFYVYWSVPIGILFTLLGLLFTPMSMAYYANSVCLLSFGILFYAFYVYFGAYTIYAFVKKKSDAVFVAKYNLIILFASNLLVLLTGATGTTMLDTPLRITSSLIWSVIFFLYLIFSDDVKYRFPKENRVLSKHNKIIFIASIILPVLLYLGAIVEIGYKAGGYTILSSDEKKIEQICSQTRTQLPMQAGPDTYWIDLTMADGVVEYRYEYNEEVYEALKLILSDDFFEMMRKYQAEYIKFSLANIYLTEADELLKIVAKSGDYDLLYSYYSPDAQHMFSVKINRDELRSIYDAKSYNTSAAAFQSLLESYNKLMPIEYIPGCLLNACTLSEDDSTLHYDFKLTGMTMGDLAGLTKDYLKSYMLELIPYFSDAPYHVARMNKLNLAYEFMADCSSWWDAEVLIMSNEYILE